MKLWLIAICFLAIPGVFGFYGIGSYGIDAYGVESIAERPDILGGDSGIFRFDDLTVTDDDLIKDISPDSLFPIQDSPKAIVPTDNGPDILTDMQASVQIIEDQGYPAVVPKRLLLLAQRAYTQGDIGRLKELHTEITSMRKDAVKTHHLIALLQAEESSVKKSTVFSGAVVFDSSKQSAASQQLLARASRAAQRGEFALSASLATESQKMAFLDTGTSSLNGVLSPDGVFLFSLLVVLFGSGIFVLTLLPKKPSLTKKMPVSRNGQVSDRSLFLFASVLVVVATVLVLFGIAWGGALLENVHEDVSLLTRNAAERLNGLNYRVETVAEYLGVSVATNFEQKNLSSYTGQQVFISEITPLANRVGEDSPIINGVYVYFKKELSGKVAYLWVVEDDGVFVWENDTEVNIPNYLDENDPEYSVDPDYVWYYGPMQSGVPLWSDIYFDTDLKENVISYLVPVYVAGDIVAIVGVDASFTEMEQIIRGIRVYDHGYAFLLDRSGEFVVSPPDEITFDHSSLWLVTGDEGILDFNGEIWSYVRLESGHTLVVVSQKNELLQVSTQLKKRLFFTLALIVVGISGMVFLVWRVGKEYSSSDLEGNELQRLWRSFRLLLKK